MSNGSPPYAGWAPAAPVRLVRSSESGAGPEQLEGLNTAPSMRAFVSAGQPRAMVAYQQDPAASVVAGSRMAMATPDQPSGLPSSRQGNAASRSPEVSARIAAPRVHADGQGGQQLAQPSAGQYLSRKGPLQPTRTASSKTGAGRIPPQAAQAQAQAQAQAGASHTLGVAATFVVPPPSWSSRSLHQGAATNGSDPQQDGARNQALGTGQAGETPISATPTLSPIPTPSEPGVRASAVRARSVEPPGQQMQSSQASPPSSRSLPQGRVASSFVPAAPRFYSYTPAVGANRPFSFTPGAGRGAQLGYGGRPNEVPLMPVRFLEGLSRPVTSPLLANSGQAARDPLMASMQGGHVQSMMLEGIASAPGRNSVSRIMQPAAKAVSSSSARRSEYATTSPSHVARSVQPTTPGAASSREDVKAEGSPTPPPAVMNNSPPLTRYVFKGDGTVEKQQDTLQATQVPALAAAAMAAVKEAAGRSGAHRRAPPSEAASQPSDTTPGGGPIAVALEVAAAEDGLVNGNEGGETEAR